MSKFFSVKSIVLVLVMMTGCGINPKQENNQTTLVPAPLSTLAIHPSPTFPQTPTATNSPTFTPLPTTTFTPFPLPGIMVLMKHSIMPAGQYILYWDTQECVMHAVSMAKKTYDLTSGGCGIGENPRQESLWSTDGRYLITPYEKEFTLYDLQSQQIERLSSSMRTDCVIDSISLDGVNFVGHCDQSNGAGGQIGIRTINNDWTIVLPSTDPYAYMNYVTISPDGTQLAYQRDGDPKGVFVLDLEKCLQDPTGCSSQAKNFYPKVNAMGFTWSPDSKKFAVNLANILAVCDVSSASCKDIFEYTDGRILDGISWMPDGKSIGFGFADPNGRPISIYMVSVDTGAITFLTNQNVLEVAGAFSITH